MIKKAFTQIKGHITHILTVFMMFLSPVSKYVVTIWNWGKGHKSRLLLGVGGLIAAFIFIIIVWYSPTRMEAAEIQRAPKMASGLFSPSSWFRNEKTIVYLLNGKSGVSITPNSITVQKGQNLALWVDDGQIANWKGENRGAEEISSAKVIQFTIPGKEGMYQLNPDQVTEFQIQKTGEMVFSAKKFGRLFTGDISGDDLEVGPLELKVAFLKQPTGTGGLPVESFDIPTTLGELGEKAEEVKTFIEKILPKPENKYPNFNLLEEARKESDSAEIKTRIKAITSQMKKDWKKVRGGEK